jgi:Calcineurin-like phosphoesterase
MVKVRLPPSKLALYFLLTLSAEDLDWGPIQDIRSEAVMNAVLSVESPQLTVLNGDLITGENTFRENSSSYLDKVVRPLVNHGMTWASTYGNHDSDFNLSSEALLKRERRYRNSRTQSMVSSSNAGVTNYYLPVYPSRKSGSKARRKPALLLWFFDSRGGSNYQELDDKGNQVPQPSWVDESVSSESIVQLYV